LCANIFKLIVITKSLYKKVVIISDFNTILVRAISEIPPNTTGTVIFVQHPTLISPYSISAKWKVLIIFIIFASEIGLKKKTL